ncbi:MAG: hypothetical protein K9J49_08135 [Candidatus Methylopumilus sp.]|nr:hypothetical protein [Candidatus Methylopumilus sp.]
MQAIALNALSGWRWISDGWALFRTQPLAFFSWAMFISLLLMVASIAPPIGPIVFVILMPAVTVVTLSAGRHAAQGDKMLLNMWLEPLKPSGVFKRLVGMGALYLVTCLLLGLLAFLPFAAEVSEALKAMTDANNLMPLLEAVRTPMIIFAVFYMLMAAIFWYAPVLVAWHQLSVTRALFFSGIACWRNKWVFLVYGISWLGVFLAIDSALSLLVWIGLPNTIAATVQVPINIVGGAVLYCSFYPSYASVFMTTDAEQLPA